MLKVEAEVACSETPEETEQEVKRFIEQKLEIKENIQFHVTHRLRPRKDGKPNNIVAKFEKRKDRNLVLKAARSKLKESEFKVHEQFPPEIIARRNELWSAFRHHQQQEDTVKFYDGKLIVNGRRIYPSTYRQPLDQTYAPYPVQHTRYPPLQMPPQQNSQQQFPQPGPSFVPNFPRYQPHTRAPQPFQQRTGQTRFPVSQEQQNVRPPMQPPQQVTY
ncbi:unnamed protein product [Mytilus coruscus]|uniref:Uncharacterized protein n=1 Tax=Mytilus coruscus TaxID=42192 RepID=A0A6J8B4M7_MYTCO|nr:unnamed protein product [Mytilus coruscus]